MSQVCWQRGDELRRLHAAAGFQDIDIQVVSLTIRHPDANGFIPGLHFQDIQQLLVVLHRLRDHGNTVIIIEHNLDVIKTADWVVDLGPEGGSGGGQIIAVGTPEQVAASDCSHTGRFLKPVLDAASSQMAPAA